MENKFNSAKWIREFKTALFEEKEKEEKAKKADDNMQKKGQAVHSKDLLHTTKVDDKKADKVDMKIGAEKNVDRVAFTNAATQINRNNKRLDYVQDKVITKVPTVKEIKDSVEFANEVLTAEAIAYDDFVSGFKMVSGQDSRFLDMPIPTKSEF